MLGEVESNSTSNYELFDVGSRCQRLAEECWVRFLKIRVLSHHRMEDRHQPTGRQTEEKLSMIESDPTSGLIYFFG